MPCFGKVGGGAGWVGVWEERKNRWWGITVPLAIESVEILL